MFVYENPGNFSDLDPQKFVIGFTVGKHFSDWNPDLITRPWHIHLSKRSTQRKFKCQRGADRKDTCR